MKNKGIYIRIASTKRTENVTFFIWFIFFQILLYAGAFKKLLLIRVEDMRIELTADIVPDRLSYLSHKIISAILLPHPIRTGFLGGLQ